MTAARRATRRSRQPAIDLPPEDRRTLEEVARDYVQRVMEICRGNRTNTARALGIDRKTLARFVKRWNIKAALEPRVLQPGSLVAFEGIDGAGLTTQAEMLVSYLNDHGHRAIYTTEPSMGPVGHLLRVLLAEPPALSHPGTLRTLSLLFAADRIDHFHRVVAPALAANVTVVSDRWYHSSLAYQRTGIERDWIMALNRHLRTPDITIVLDVSPEVGQQRRLDAGRRPARFHDLATQRAVVAGYRVTIAELRAEGEHIELVDGERPPATVSAYVLRALGLARTRMR